MACAPRSLSWRDKRVYRRFNPAVGWCRDSCIRIHCTISCLRCDLIDLVEDDVMVGRDSCTSDTISRWDEHSINLFLLSHRSYELFVFVKMAVEIDLHASNVSLQTSKRQRKGKVRFYDMMKKRRQLNRTTNILNGGGAAWLQHCLSDTHGTTLHVHLV